MRNITLMYRLTSGFSWVSFPLDILPDDETIRIVCNL